MKRGRVRAPRCALPYAGTEGRRGARGFGGDLACTALRPMHPHRPSRRRRCRGSWRTRCPSMPSWSPSAGAARAPTSLERSWRSYRSCCRWAGTLRGRPRGSTRRRTAARPPLKPWSCAAASCPPSLSPRRPLYPSPCRPSTVSRPWDSRRSPRTLLRTRPHSAPGPSAAGSRSRCSRRGAGPGNGGRGTPGAAACGEEAAASAAGGGQRVRRWAREVGGSGEGGPAARPTMRSPNKGFVPHRVGPAVSGGMGQGEVVPWLGETPGLGCARGWQWLLQGGHRAREHEECGSPPARHQVWPPSSAPHMATIWGRVGALCQAAPLCSQHPWEVSTAWVHPAVLSVPRKRPQSAELSSAGRTRVDPHCSAVVLSLRGWTGRCRREAVGKLCIFQPLPCGTPPHSHAADSALWFVKTWL